MLKERCYMCNEIAVSVEHVPPKCLFPEFKDAGENLRLNLITIPSCDKHNGQKSHDDEFLMVSIAGIIGNNSIGYQHYKGKIQRTLKRSSFRLLNKIFLHKKIVKIEHNNKFINLICGTPDYNRLAKCFIHIAFGIYRHHCRSNFVGEVKPYLSFLYSDEHNPNTFKELINDMATIELVDKHRYGNNQEVFYYQLIEPDKYGLFLIKLCFYNNINVFVAYIPAEAQKPFLLGQELINSGFHTVIHHKTKKYKFNN